MDMLLKYKEMFSPRDEIGTCPNIEVEIDVVDKSPLFMLPLVTYTSKYYQYVYPHVDPHLSPPTAQWWVSMCIRPVCIYIDHLEVFSRDRTGIVNAPEGFLCNFNKGPSPAM